MKQKGKVQGSYVRLLFNSDELKMIGDAILAKQMNGEYKVKQHTVANGIIFKCSNALNALANEHTGLTKEMN